MRQKTWKTPHPHVAESLVLLAQICQSQHKVDEAECLYQEALDMYKAVYGTCPHPDVAKALDAFASLMRDTNQQDAEKSLRKRAEQLRVGMLNSTGPSMQR
jgi:hypothetical protein